MLKIFTCFGRHNIENIMVASSMAYIIGIKRNIIKNAIKEFKAVEHRIEYVANKNGRYYYNDSKGTNPDSTIKAINAMNRRTVLLLGGSDKNSDFTKLVKAFNKNIVFVVLYGEVKEKIKKTLEENGWKDYVVVNTMEEALKEAEKHSKEEMNILLSPACASFDQYKNYEERRKSF